MIYGTPQIIETYYTILMDRYVTNINLDITARINLTFNSSHKL